jgi:hypothetical protein
MKNWLWVIGICLVFTGSAFGAAITFSSSAEFGATGAVFSNTRISGEGVALKISGGGMWTENGVRVTSNTQDQDQVAMDGDGSGGAYIAWRDKRTNPFGDIYASRVNSSGSIVSGWATAVTTGTPGVVTNEAPDITKSINGAAVDGMVVTWIQHNGSPYYQDIYAKKLDPDGNALWTVGVCTLEATQYGPKIVSDRNGGAVIVWGDYRESIPAIYAQKVDSGGQAVWTTNGITVCASIVDAKKTAANNPQIAFFGSSDGYMIGWYDQRDGYQDLYARRLLNDGTFSSAFLSNGIKVSTSTSSKELFSLSYGFIPPSYYLPIFTWKEVGGGVQRVYGQWLRGSGLRGWTDTGAQVYATVSRVTYPSVTVTPSGESIFSWDVFYGGVSYEAFVQMLNISGEAMWTSGGKSLGQTYILKIVSDGARGAYAAAIGISGYNLYPYAQRIDEAGNKVWDENGVQLSVYPLTGEISFSNLVFESVGPVYAWADSRSGNLDVFTQKASDLFYRSGTWTSPKTENTDVKFAAWGVMTREVTGSGLATVEVKTATSSSGLDTASWTEVANGGNIPGSGKWIQARVNFLPDSSRFSTPLLQSLSLSYSVDTAYPSIESVKADTVTLSTSTTTDIAPSPTIEATLTDDYPISSADIKVDGVSTSPPLPSPSTRWVIKSTITTPLSAGSHTVKVEVTDSAGNPTTNTYNVAVASRAEVKSGSIAGFSEGSKITVAYELSLPADVTIEIRTLTGELVKKFTAGGGTVGGNSISVDRSELGKGAYIVIISPAGGTPVSGTAVF